jgi:uncharacterized protein YjbI with pentapeptide repeats
MAQDPQQPDRSARKTKKKSSPNNFSKSIERESNVIKTAILPCLVALVASLVEVFSHKDYFSGVYGVSGYIFLSAFLYFFIFIFLQSRINLKTLNSYKFWLFGIVFVFLVVAHYYEWTTLVIIFFTENWLVPLIIFSTILVFLSIKKPPQLIRFLRKKELWILLFTFVCIFVFYKHKETVVFLSRFGFFLLGFVLVVFSLIAVWKIPIALNKTLETKNGRDELSDFEREEKRLKLIDDSRKTVATIIGGLFVLFGAIFTYNNYNLAYEGQITDRFSKSVTLLENKDLSIRLGGLYALERIAKDSPKDHSAIMEILCDFIREKSKEQRESYWKEQDAKQNEIASNTNFNTGNINSNIGNVNSNISNSNLSKSNINSITNTNLKVKKKTKIVVLSYVSEYNKELFKKLNVYNEDEGLSNIAPSNEIITAITIIKNRVIENDKEDFIFNLEVANLSGINLNGIVLKNANLSGVNFKNAKLYNANLADTQLNNANFEHSFSYNINFTHSKIFYVSFFDAFLDESDFSSAEFKNVDFTEASLDDSIFSNSSLHEVNFEKATLYGAKLKNHTSLSDNIKQAKINETTEFPEKYENLKQEMLQKQKENQ